MKSEGRAQSGRVHRLQKMWLMGFEEIRRLMVDP